MSVLGAGATALAVDDVHADGHAGNSQVVPVLGADTCGSGFAVRLAFLFVAELCAVAGVEVDGSGCWW